MSDQFWRMQYPIAFSSMLMDEEMYKQLTDERARNGLRINNVPMQVWPTNLYSRSLNPNVLGYV